MRRKGTKHLKMEEKIKIVPKNKRARKQKRERGWR